MITSISILVALVGIILSAVTVLVLDLADDVKWHRAINRRLDGPVNRRNDSETVSRSRW